MQKTEDALGVRKTAGQRSEPKNGQKTIAKNLTDAEGRYQTHLLNSFFMWKYLLLKYILTFIYIYDILYYDRYTTSGKVRQTYHDGRINFAKSSGRTVISRTGGNTWLALAVM